MRFTYISLEVGSGMAATSTEIPSPAISTLFVNQLVFFENAANGVVYFTIFYITHVKPGFPHKLMTGIEIPFRGYHQILYSCTATGNSFSQARAFLQVQVVMEKMNTLP